LSRVYFIPITGFKVESHTSLLMHPATRLIFRNVSNGQTIEVKSA